MSVSKPFHDTEVAKFQANRKLCPVLTLQKYLNRTHVRNTCSFDTRQFLQSYSKPHCQLVSSTVSRWLQTILEEAGVDTSCFKAHLTKSVSTSAAARAGVTMQDNMKMTDWSSATTFANVYSRSSSHADLG